MRINFPMAMLASLVLAATACGSDKKTGAGAVTTPSATNSVAASPISAPVVSPTSAPATSQITTPATEASSPSNDTQTQAPTDPGSDFCVLAAQLNAPDAPDLSGVFSGVGKADQIKQAFGELLGLVQGATAAAPSEIKADMELLLGQFVGLQDALAAQGYDPAKLSSSPAGQAAIDSMSGEQFIAAGDRVDAFTTTTCGAFPES